MHDLWYYKSIETIENACFQNACLIFIRSFQMSFNFFHTLHLHLVIFLSFVISVNWWTIFCFVTTWWEISIIQKSIDKWLEQPLLDLRLQHAIMYMMIIDYASRFMTLNFKFIWHISIAGKEYEIFYLLMKFKDVIYAFIFPKISQTA